MLFISQWVVTLCVRLQCHLVQHVLFFFYQFGSVSVHLLHSLLHRGSPYKSPSKPSRVMRKFSLYKDFSNFGYKCPQTLVLAFSGHTIFKYLWYPYFSEVHQSISTTSIASRSVFVTLMERKRFYTLHRSVITSRSQHTSSRSSIQFVIYPHISVPE